MVSKTVWAGVAVVVVILVGAAGYLATMAPKATTATTSSSVSTSSAVSTEISSQTQSTSQTVLSTQTVALPSTSSTTSSSTIRSSTNTSVPLQTSTSSTTSSSSQRIISVSIVNGASGNQSLGFSPKTITVVIGVNNTVTWTNNDISLHTVTCINPPTGAQQFNSGFLSSGQTFTMTFTVPGTYTYFCQIHSWMIATIIVKS